MHHNSLPFCLLLLPHPLPGVTRGPPPYTFCLQISGSQSVVQGNGPLPTSPLHLTWQEMRISRHTAPQCDHRSALILVTGCFWKQAGLLRAPEIADCAGATLVALGCWDASSRVACHSASNSTFCYSLLSHPRAFWFSRGPVVKLLDSAWS